MVNSGINSSKMTSQNSKFIICGTDTDVGKTIVSAFFVQGLIATYWKPIQSGLENGGDTGQISKILKLPKNRFIDESYKFKAAVSPHWAAEKENREINLEKLHIPIIKNNLIIETAGGLMVPLNRNWLQIDQIKIWNKPVILVARSGLGTINHTLLSIEALRKRSIKILGIVFNGKIHEDNPKTINKFSGIPVICQLPILKNITALALKEQWEKQKMDDQMGRLLEDI